MGLKRQTIDGIKWQVGLSFMQKAISLATGIIIARKLGPSVYGLFAFAMIVVGSFELFKSLGVDSALVRKKDDFNEAADTVFYIVPLMGIILFILLNIFAVTISNYLKSPALVPVLRVLGITFVVRCFSKVPSVVLERSIQFKKVSLAELASSLLFSLTAVVLTYMNFSIWALVYAYIIRSLLYMAIVWSVAKWRPHFRFNIRLAIEMLDFGKYVFLTAVLWFTKMYLDNLLVGKILGIASLGLYAVAFNISNFGADYFGGKVYTVTYPAYAKMQDDVLRLKSAYLKVFRYLGLVGIPLGIGIIMLGGEFLKFFYGSKWEGAVPVLGILAWGGIFNTLTSSSGGVFLALGKPKAGLILAVLQVVIFIVFISPMAHLLGMNGVGMVVSFSSFTAFSLSLIYISRVLSIKPGEIFDSLSPAIFSSLIMAMVIMAFRYAAGVYHWGFLQKYDFILMGFVSVGVYAISVYSLEKSIFHDMKGYIFERT